MRSGNSILRGVLRQLAFVFLSVVFAICSATCLSSFPPAGRFEAAQECGGGGSGDRIVGSAQLSLVPYGKVCNYTDITGELPGNRTFTDLGTPYLLTGMAAALVLIGMTAPAAFSRIRRSTFPLPPGMTRIDHRR